MCKLKKNMSNAAGQFGFGMSAAIDGDYDKKMDEAYAQSMANFSAGHANTTSTISGLQNTIAQQQQQLVMMQQHIAANAYAAPPQYAAPAQANNIYQDGFSSQVKHVCTTLTHMVWPSTLILRTA